MKDKSMAKVFFVMALILTLICTVSCTGDKYKPQASVSTYSSESTHYSPGRKSNECILRHCDFSAKSGSNYCSRHGCCKDGCPNQKDPMVHCCNAHNCAEPGCGLHRYDYTKSKYCKTHYVHHYNG